MRKSSGFALLSIFFTGLFLRLLPLSEQLYWGADFGEYYSLTENLVTSGFITLPYYGWGFTYPYFPGMLFLNAILGLTGVSLPAVNSLLIVFLTSFSIFPIFLLGRTFLHEDSGSLIAAGVIATSMPTVYITSHGVPGSLADLLFVTCLLLFIKAHSYPKMYYLLYPISLALILTHHLTTYFLIIVLVAGIFIQELVARKSDSGSLKLSILFLVFLITSSFVYWLAYAVPFRDVILSKVFGSWLLVVFLFLVMLALFYSIVILRRKSGWRYKPRYPDLRKRVPILCVGILTAYGIMAVNVFIGVPGTSITLSPWAFVYFGPLLVVFSFATIGRPILDFSRRGIHVSSWFFAVLASLIFSVFFSREVLLPYRHIQYMMPAIALLSGVGISRMTGLMSIPSKRRKILAGGVIIMALVILAATTYPKADLTGGWDEGIRAEQISNAFFSRLYADGLVASDHIGSTLIFGFGRANATWDTAPDSLLADSFDEAKSEMENVDSPSGEKRAYFVAIDKRLESGATLFPWNPAVRLSNEAIDKFERSPYMKLYDNGYSRFYLVNWGLA